MDPYSLVRKEVETSLQTASALHDSLVRIEKTLPRSSHAQSVELRWSRDELKGTLLALQADVDELEQSVDVVARDPRYGVGHNELASRREFVERVRGQVDYMRRATVDPQTESRPRRQPPTAYPPSSINDTKSGLGQDDVDDNDNDKHTDLHRAYAAQQQQVLVENQDRLLDGISSTVTTLKAQAGTMGREILDQVGLLDDLESGVDRSQGRLDRANQRMRQFVRDNARSGSSWTILILIAVLSILLFLIVVV